jgi:hypothetical protein
MINIAFDDSCATIGAANVKVLEKKFQIANTPDVMLGSNIFPVKK